MPNQIYKLFYVARQPIFNNYKHIWGYELLFRSGPGKTTAEISNQDLSTMCVATCGFALAQESSGMSKKLSINFTEKLLLEKSPRALPPSITVIEVLEDIKPTNELMDILIQLKEEGYLIAIDDYEGGTHQKELLN